MSRQFPNTTVGVIAGLSPLSTLGFLEKLVRWSSADEGGGGGGGMSPPFIVSNDPVRLSTYDRDRLNINPKNGRHGRLDPGPVVEKLRQQRLFLERSGARCIVMPCHISHSWFNDIAYGCSVPFLHAAHSVATELKASNMRPVQAGTNVCIGILGTQTIIDSGFYQSSLNSQGFEVMVPDKATMEHTVIPAMEAYHRKDIEGARNLLRIALQLLLVRAVNTVILASDHLCGLLPHHDPLCHKCIDPMDALVRSTIQWARSASTSSGEGC
ncbi:Asp/Glu/hydantoin racemase protein [Dioscorea alata]|uniref:Asp/Glu/hydantoin racemase protein n=2 Tax=Dioscorea alata TaxID=55571 RepID=A0ACB7TUV5_DIOAL|nr:Asp/Glu/hydantoin racemase protein [Dioscorea alata]KAH7652158.1 Asp/Glu/hydantoin racemase protein [Dioscorea alata]